MPACAVVRSFVLFKNAIMLIPCWPSAGPDWRRGRGFASGQLQGDDGLNLFCHENLFPEGPPRGDCA